MVMVACQKQEHSEKDPDEIRFRYYNLEKIGWKSVSHSQSADNITYTATQVPIQYYLLKDQGNTDLVKIDSLYDLNKNERIIEFVFEDVNKRDLLEEQFTQLDYKNSIEYLSFKIQKDFLVITDHKDTIACSGVIFERNFKVTPNNKVLLFFSGVAPKEKIQLVYNDRLFHNGILKFHFKQPILKL